MNQYFHACCCQVLHLANLYLSLLGRLQDAVDEGAWLAGCTRRLAEWNLRDGQCLLVAFLNLGTHSYCASTLSVVVLRHVNRTASGEVGIEVELLTMQVTDGGIANLVQVVGQYLATQSHGNTLSPLCQQQRELDG